MVELYISPTDDCWRGSGMPKLMGQARPARSSLMGCWIILMQACMLLLGIYPCSFSILICMIKAALIYLPWCWWMARVIESTTKSNNIFGCESPMWARIWMPIKRKGHRRKGTNPSTFLIFICYESYDIHKISNNHIIRG